MYGSCVCFSNISQTTAKKQVVPDHKLRQNRKQNLKSYLPELTSFFARLAKTNFSFMCALAEVFFKEMLLSSYVWSKITNEFNQT